MYVQLSANTTTTTTTASSVDKENTEKKEKESSSSPLFTIEDGGSDDEEEDDIPARPTWIKDEEAPSCQKCNTEFSLIRRRHHCRACGKIFCSLCSDKWILLPDNFAYDQPERVCMKCYRRFSPLDFDRTFDKNGPEASPTIVLLHGAVGNRWNFFYQMRALAAVYHVIAMDLPGHGSRVHELLTMNSAVAAVRDIIKRHAHEGKALIVGHEMGGYVAMVVGKRHPELCHGLVLSGCAYEWHGVKEQVQLHALGLLYKLTPVSKQWKYKDFKNLPQDRVRECFLRPGLDFRAWPQIRDLIVEPREGYFKTAIANYSGPTLFIRGGSDDKNTAEQDFLIAAQNGRLVIIKDGNEYLYIQPESCDKYNEVILNFAKDIGMLGIHVK